MPSRSVVVMTLELLRLPIGAADRGARLRHRRHRRAPPPSMAGSRIIGDLRPHLPRVQLIATTHSPGSSRRSSPTRCFASSARPAATNIVRVSDRISARGTRLERDDVAFGAPDLAGPRWLHAPSLQVRRELLRAIDEGLATRRSRLRASRRDPRQRVRDAFGESSFRRTKGRWATSSSSTSRPALRGVTLASTSFARTTASSRVRPRLAARGLGPLRRVRSRGRLAQRMARVRRARPRSMHRGRASGSASCVEHCSRAWQLVAIAACGYGYETRTTTITGAPMITSGPGVGEAELPRTFRVDVRSARRVCRTSRVRARRRGPGVLRRHSIACAGELMRWRSASPRPRAVSRSASRGSTSKCARSARTDGRPLSAGRRLWRRRSDASSRPAVRWPRFGSSRSHLLISAWKTKLSGRWRASRQIFAESVIEVARNWRILFA